MPAPAPALTAPPAPQSRRPWVTRRHTGRRRWVAPLTAVTAVAVTTDLGVRAVSDPSPWLHLKIGAYLLDGGRFGVPDPWSPFATRPFVLTEWLPAVVGQLVYRTVGLPGLAWLRCLGVLAVLTALVWTTRRVSRPAVAATTALVAVLGAWQGLTERPQLAGLALLALAVGGWWRTAVDGRPRWWLVPLTWLWACCHGSWAIGVGLGLVMVAASARNHKNRNDFRRPLAVPLACLLAAAVTPVGPRLLLTPFTVGSNARQFVAEWQPTSVRDPWAVLTLAMIGLVVLAWARSRATPPAWQVVMALCALGATLVMARTVAVGAIIIAPLLAQEVERAASRLAPAHGWLSWRLWAALVAACLLLAVPLSAARAQHAVGVPSGLDGRLAAIPRGSVVLSDGDLSGWLMWAYPQVVPALDLRNEVYAPGYVRSYVRTMAAGPDWRGFLTRTGARYALVRHDSPIAAALEDRAGWRRDGADAGFVLLERS